MGHITTAPRWSWVLFAAVLWFVIFGGLLPARACVGDCNGNGTVVINELITGVNIAHGNQPLSNCPSFDANSNGTVAINELILGVNNALNGCGPIACTAAEVRVSVVNRSATSASVTLSGFLLDPICGQGTLAAEYPGQTLTIPGSCSGTSCNGVCSVGTCTCETVLPDQKVPKCSISVTSLTPGPWRHGISVSAPTTGQKQYQRGGVVAGSVNDVSWTVFRTVKTVTPTYALNNAITAANLPDAPAPVLIQFDHAQFTQGIADNTLPNAGAVPINKEIVIDGTNSAGNPSSLDDFATRVYPTIVTMNPPDPKNQANAATLRFNERVGLIGLDIRRILGKDADIGSIEQQMVWLRSNSKGSFIRTCRIDGGAAARGEATCNSGNKTCIDANAIGSSGFSDAAVVEQSEVRHCYRRAAAINNGHLVMRDNWMHHNRKGGPLVNSNAGKLQLARNLIEDDGKNCPGAMKCVGGTRNNLPCTVDTGCPTSVGCKNAQGVDDGVCQLDSNYSNDPAACGTTFIATDLNEIDVDNGTEATAARLETDGDIVRNIVGRGIVLRENAEADIKNTYICGLSGVSPYGYGIHVLHDPTPAPTPKMNVHGSAMAFNVRGVQIQRDQGDPLGRPGNINFGDRVGLSTPNPGNNAFTMNGGVKENFAYSDQPNGADRFAEGNQWEHCGIAGTCSITNIKNKDVNESAGGVDVNPAQAHRNASNPLSIDSVSPKKVTRRGAVVTIIGKGFNAVDGYQSRTPTPGVTGATDCVTLADGNKCNPLQGVCVEFKDDYGNWVPADDVLAVTPTTIVVKSSIACSKSREVRVRRQDNSQGGFSEDSEVFCTN